MCDDAALYWQTPKKGLKFNKRWATMFFLLYSKQCDIKKLNGSFLNILPAFNDHGNLLYMKKLIRCCVNIPFGILITEKETMLEQDVWLYVQKSQNMTAVKKFVCSNVKTSC